MKIILAILTIAGAAAFFALRDGDARPAGEAPGEVVPLNSVGGPGSIDASTVGPIAAPNSNLPRETVADDADNLLAAAIDRLNRCDSLTALMRYRIRLFESDLIGSGLYQQAGQGSERRFRLELKTQLGEKLTSHLEVCDGRTLWTYEDKSNGPQLSRLDLARVRAAQRQAAHASPNSPVEELPAGGLPKLLSGLRVNFRGIAVEPGYLGESAVWAIDAEWKPDVLAALTPDQRERINAGGVCDFTKLPQLPERVMAFLGHDDLFPRRIEFRRRADGGAGQGSGGEFLPVATVEFTDVQFNQPIDNRQFDYQQGEAGEDVTEKFLQSRGLAPAQ